MTSSTGSAEPDVIRPLTEEELAVQCMHNASGLLREAQKKIDTAWASLPAGTRRTFGSLEAAVLARIAADGLDRALADSSPEGER